MCGIFNDCFKRLLGRGLFEMARFQSRISCFLFDPWISCFLWGKKNVPPTWSKVQPEKQTTADEQNYSQNIEKHWDPRRHDPFPVLGS